MSAHLTEEEQLEAMKRWWDENGKNTVIAVVVAVAGYFGFEAWQDSARAAEEAASNKYQTLIEAVVVAPGTVLDDTQRATAESLANELKQQAADGFYGQSAALFIAKLAVESQELDKAEAELQWLLEQQPEQAMALVTRLRLARVQGAAGKFDQALATLQAVDAGSFAASYSEVRGDILLAKGQVETARTAYQLALQSLAEGNFEQNKSIQMKLDDLVVATAAVEVAQ